MHAEKRRCSFLPDETIRIARPGDDHPAGVNDAADPFVGQRCLPPQHVRELVRGDPCGQDVRNPVLTQDRHPDDEAELMTDLSTPQVADDWCLGREHSLEAVAISDPRQWFAEWTVRIHDLLSVRRRQADRGPCGLCLLQALSLIVKTGNLALRQSAGLSEPLQRADRAAQFGIDACRRGTCSLEQPLLRRLAIVVEDAADQDGCDQQRRNERPDHEEEKMRAERKGARRTGHREHTLSAHTEAGNSAMRSWIGGFPWFLTARSSLVSSSTPWPPALPPTRSSRPSDFQKRGQKDK